MYKVYMVPDATDFRTRSEMYASKLLLWDPYAESDAYALIGPKLKSELNKADSFEFTILPTNIQYDSFHKRKTVVMLYDDDKFVFEGVVTDCPVDFFKQRKVTCSGPLSYLCDSIQAPDEKNEIVVPKASGQIYSQVPTAWYNNANPKNLGWYERSGPDEDGNYTYTLTTDKNPDVSKIYYYLTVGDEQNYSGGTIKRKAATSETIANHLTRLLDVHNSQVDMFKRIHLNNVIGDTTKHDFKSSNYRETWNAIKTDIIDEYGRYIKIELNDSYELELNYIEITNLDSRQTPATSIEFTKNMIEMSESDDSDDDVFTVLVPIGKNGLTIKDLDGHKTPEDDDRNLMINPYAPDGDNWGGNRRYIVVSDKAVKEYGYIVKTQTFSDAKTAAKLWEYSLKYIKNNFDYHKEYEVKGIDMHIINPSVIRTNVGKKCRVKSDWHGVDETALYVISAEHDLVNPENDTYKIGVPTSDREATNKTLTSQTTSSSSSSKKDTSNNASDIQQIKSWLDEWFDEENGWLMMNHKFKNEQVSENERTRTRFEQDEEHINMYAQKIFGLSGDDEITYDQDAGYIKIPKPPYRRTGQGIEDYYEANGSYKVPCEHNWYEKNNNGKYVKSTQDTRVTQAQVDNDNVDFYIMRLATRNSQIDVGPGGLKATVDGNYETSTYCSSWITANEDQILALTGHLYVDEDGHVHVTSGSGMRTDHEEEDTTEKYIQVQRTMYAEDPNPKDKKWYERNLNGPGGSWPGLNKADQETNDAYYKRTQDTVVDRSKFYYYKSYIRETFVSEFGVYDEDNLTAGVMVQMINHPTYHRVAYLDVYFCKLRNESPKAKGWYEYNKKKGTYGITLDETVGSVFKEYYYVVNNSEYYTDIYGAHVVIGKTAGYTGLDADTQAKVDKYIADNNLNGTITEIASDVVTVNTLIAKYIDADDITVNTSLWADYIWGNHISASLSLTAGTYVSAPDYWLHTNPERDPTEDDSIKHGLISTINSTKDGNIVDGGTITATTEGDTVTLSFYTRDNIERSVSFDKPASLGTVTWSRGGDGKNTLTIKTVGGKDFLVGEVRQYEPNNLNEYQAAQNAPYLVTEKTGYDTPFGLYYYKKIAGITTLVKSLWFRTPKNRYKDATDTVRTQSTTGKVDDEEISLDVGGVSTVRAQYKTEDNLDNEVDSYVSLKGIKSYAPEIRIRATYNSVDYAANSTITLDYGDSVDVKTQKKAHDENEYSDYRKLTVKAPTDRYNTGYDACVSTIRTYSNWAKTDNEEIVLGYSGSAKVYAQYETKNGVLTNKNGVTVKAPTKGLYRTYAKRGSAVYTSGTIALGENDEVTVYGQRKMDDDDDYKSAVGITITSPASSGGGAPEISTDDIQIPSSDSDIQVTNTIPTGGRLLTTLKSKILQAINNSANKIVVFKVKVDGTSAEKTYYMNFV